MVGLTSKPSRLSSFSTAPRIVARSHAEKCKLRFLSGLCIARRIPFFLVEPTPGLEPGWPDHESGALPFMLRRLQCGNVLRDVPLELPDGLRIRVLIRPEVPEPLRVVARCSLTTAGRHLPCCPALAEVVGTEVDTYELVRALHPVNKSMPPESPQGRVLSWSGQEELNLHNLNTNEAHCHYAMPAR